MYARRNKPLLACDGRLSCSRLGAVPRGRIEQHGLNEAHQSINLHDGLARHASRVRVKGKTAWQTRRPRILWVLPRRRFPRRRPSPGVAVVRAQRSRQTSLQRLPPLRLRLRMANLLRKRRPSPGAAGLLRRRPRMPVRHRASFRLRRRRRPPWHRAPRQRKHQSPGAAAARVPR